MNFKLEKNVTLYKAQFDTFNLNLTQSHELDRVSLELDSILFRIKYMKKKGYDLSNIEDLKQQFTQKSIRLRELFGAFMYELLTTIVTIPVGCHIEDIKDVVAQDVKIDNNYVKFKMILISENKSYLEFVDEVIPDDDVYNIAPSEYFRFSTDSYNDAIAKAYPELFENKMNEKAGTGADQEVFVHNLTFQVGEGCSLNCTYCLRGDMKILLEDGSELPIRNIKEGDIILAFDENATGDTLKLKPTKVTKVFRRKLREPLYQIINKDTRRNLIITGEHPMFTGHGWINAAEIFNNKNTEYDIYHINDKGEITNSKTFSIKIYSNEQYVYNLETESHTYIANGYLVHNCYQFNKTPMRMQLSTATKFIDNLLADNYGYINRYNSPAIIIEFIGGEPLLEIKLIREIYEYFLDKCYEMNHPWFSLHRVSICSNGLQYFEPAVQSFFRDYAHNVSFNISIDGNKELHDACRIQPNGEGSYDIAMTALNHYNKHYTTERNSKMTLAPSNISYLFDSVVDFIKHDMKCININCVFEEGWTKKTARIEFEQLTKLAKYILDHDLEHIYIAIFNDRQEYMTDPLSDGSYCGGNGSMLAIRPNGQFYPCIRYMPTSVGPNVKDLCIGSVDKGFEGRAEDSSILKLLDGITRRSQTTDICWECPISNDCANCTALGHALFGTPNKRTTFICIQMVAEALANVYYWNHLLIKHLDWDLKPRRNMVPLKWMKLVLTDEEIENMKMLETYAVYKYLEKEMAKKENNGEGT